MKENSIIFSPPNDLMAEELERLRNENKLLNAQLQLAEELIDSSIDCQIAMDRDLNITMWNKTSSLYNGYCSKEVKGKNFYEVFPEARDNPHIGESFRHALQGLKVYLPVEKGINRNGHFETHFIPLRQEDGAVYGIMMIMHDVAHRVKAENKLKELNEELSKRYAELQSTNAELATYTYITSHDLKEPLRKIYLFIEMVLKKEANKMTDEGKENMSRVKSAVQRLSLLADGLVSFSEIKEEPHKPFSLNKALKDAITLLGPAIQEREAVININELPTIAGSEWQFRILFQQLISNAIKFQPRGNNPVVQVKSSYPVTIPSATGAANTYLCLSVSDNGIGIEPQYHKKVFNMFARLHSKHEFPGVGMGLTMVKKITEKHGGFITVDSIAGKGSVFNCYLPVMLMQKEQRLF